MPHSLPTHSSSGSLGRRDMEVHVACSETNDSISAIVPALGRPAPASPSSVLEPDPRLSPDDPLHPVVASTRATAAPPATLHNRKPTCRRLPRAARQSRTAPAQCLDFVGVGVQSRTPGRSSYQRLPSL